MMYHLRGHERRRTVRVPLRVNLTVHSRLDEYRECSWQAHSESVSRHGGMLVMQNEVTEGQVLVLVKNANQESVPCKVVNVRKGKDGRFCVSVEFLCSDSNFWHMVFPKPGTRQATRASRTGDLVTA